MLDLVNLKDHARNPLRSFCGGMSRDLSFGSYLSILNEPTLKAKNISWIKI